ncbi:DUF1343 domain-containing protein [Sphaerochaeta sp. PS]|uniref:exo-beta-N-acetylmuramidase NamZ family protein n=1 Tax=Sphaerochaeta sp. PS TaxID=3076336 RepID=UPI0028A47621|nr:DUF1343 domain-containing protein [Sphaerochaeta sp. PS]MDT4762141.1 DUF1343 domain-containing protein [Sphaerochaeta sp. PS]
MITCGLDRISTYPHLFDNKRLGLVTTPSAVDAHLCSSIDLFASRYNLRSLFAPEHGLYSDQGAGSSVQSWFDKERSLEVHSLYTAESKGLQISMVEGLDALVFDIQDLGLRFYTYIATLKNLLKDCATFGLPLIVLDRPNPLGGEVVEGNLLGGDSFSFVGPAAIPIRYGLTIGELALYLNATEALGCDLTVVPLLSWKRTQYFDDIQRPWIMTSPAIGHFSTALLYAGMCLFEGTNLSEGRGTSAPFELIGSPFIDPFSLAREANALALDGVAFTPAHFTPSASKYANQMCKGLYLHLLDKNRFRPVETALRLISLIAEEYPTEFVFLPTHHERSLSGFERLAGKGSIPLLLNDVEKLVQRWRSQSEAFAKKKKPYHLYG